MSDALPDRDSSEPSPPSRGPVAGEDLLPEVEAPNAGFLIQLFVVPALIVLLVVSIWLLFSWLVHRSTMNPEDLVQGLQSSRIARWQRASELADMLRGERFAEFRESGAAATKLAEILDDEIESAVAGHAMDDESINLRYFLCRALGEFRVVEGLDTLIVAATTNRAPEELMVRRGAIQAIAVRVTNLSQLDPPQPLEDPTVEAALFALASDDEALVRSETAYALGRIGTPTAVERLTAMVDDPHADTRYNATIALAEHGKPVALETLAEMLDPDETVSVREEANDAAQFYKRALIMTSALQAVESLAAQTPDADFSDVIESLERVTTATAAELEEARIRPGVVFGVKQTLSKLESLEAAP